MAGQWEYVGNLRGANGIGVPQGGGQGEVLAKAGNVDYATAWTRLRYDQIEGKVPASALPEITTAPFVVASQSAMLNLPAVPGRMAIRTDIAKTFVLAEEPASKLSNWVELKTGNAVESVNGKTGSVVLTKADVGLSKVSNTADADKPQATQKVPGLLSPGDKVKLDEADSKPKPAYAQPAPAIPGAGGGTFTPRGGNIVKYDTGTATFEVDEPTKGSHPATKIYVDGAVSSRGSSTSRVTATTDLNDLTSPGVYNVTRNSPNLPMIAEFRSSARVEVDRVHAQFYTDNFTVFQVARFNAWDTTGWAVAGAFSGEDKNKLTSSLVFRRESHNSGETWTDWRAEGNTPWFKMSAKNHVGTTFYGIACDASYPGVREVKPGSGLWRISNGMVELQLIIRSDITPKSGYLDVGQVHPALRAPSSMFNTYHVEASLNQYYGIVGSGAIYNNDTGKLELTVRGTSDGASSSSYGFSGLTWPVEIKNYGGN